MKSVVVPKANRHPRRFKHWAATTYGDPPTHCIITPHRHIEDEFGLEAGEREELFTVVVPYVEQLMESIETPHVVSVWKQDVLELTALTTEEAERRVSIKRSKKRKHAAA